VELTGIELLTGVDNTQVIDFYACQMASKDNSPNHWVHFGYSEFFPTLANK